MLTLKQPRYQQLAKTLSNEIARRVYPVGSLLPTELQLSSQFGASRSTVRQALRQLSENGMISARPGIGTKVISERPASQYRQVMQSLADVRQYAADTKLEFLATQVKHVAAEEADFLEAQPGEAWLHAAGVRRVSADQPPVCFVEIFIHPLFRSIQGLEQCTVTPVYTLIEQQFGEEISEVRHQLRAEQLPKRLAKVLEASSGKPALVVYAQYFNRHRTLVQASISTHPGDRFSYQGTFLRESSTENTGQRRAQKLMLIA
jgi:GntR family transcriptional regulator